MGFWRKLFGLPKKTEDYIPPWWEPKWNEIAARFPVGRRFEYMGRDLVVELHTFDYQGFPYSRGRPILQCGYADDNGKLHEWIFEVGSWEALPK